MPPYTTSRLRYTQQEDNIILTCVKSNPSNLECAFEMASNRLTNRTARAISQRYYSKLKSQYNTIAVASNSGTMVLGKNSVRTRIVPDSTSVRDAMLFASFSKLTKERAILFLLDNLTNEAKSNLLIRIAQRVGGH